MKTLIVIFSLMFALSGFAYEGMGPPEPADEEEAPLQYRCPVSQISDNKNCMDCHKLITVDGKPKFGLIEIPISENYSAKPYCLNIGQELIGGPPVGYMEINGTGSAKFRQVADYLAWHPEIKKLVVELHTGGGSIMDAWRTIGIIKKMQSMGIHIEMRVNGICASAGVFILVAGDTRLVNPNAELMIHKIWTFTMFDIKTPDSSQDQADVLKHFQDNINQFLRDRTNLSEDQLDNKIFKKDWWMTGAEAIALGIATGSI